PLTGAVCANIRVSNPYPRLARLQFLEYICGFNLDRRAYDAWNCITVAPGAASAFRRQAIEKAGGFISDPLAEDTDLTLRMHRARFRIKYAPRAIAWTEAPETISAFIRQRKRWSFGTLQCLWKHRDLLFHPTYWALGFFSLPSIWFCQLFLVAFTPVLDLILIASLFTGIKGVILVYILLFSIFDVLLAGIACKLDNTPPSRWAWQALPMRFFYRPLLSWIVWQSFLQALQGNWMGWGKAERKGRIPLKVSQINSPIITSPFIKGNHYDP
ncbi:MAG: glycosyltransferase family 2 protein, partial [Desulfobacterota bacterium]|nr:glycosyltransferase family 2 protein [Thermodesulfobacteriota bacterium]